jgi:transposase
MSKHKSEDYKLSAVKYYLNNDVSLDDVCEIFDCPKQSLYRWVKRYEELEEIKRLSRKPKSYKITKEQIKYVIQKLKENEQITMEELHKIIKKKYKDFDITPQHLGQVIRDNNITRKRTRHERWIKNLRFFIHPTFNKIKQSFILLNEHYPNERYGNPTDIKKELKAFYKEISKYSLDKIISLDETSIQPSMIMEFSKCELGK